MTKARDLANAGTALTAVSATELGYLDGVTSAVQTQIDAKAVYPSQTSNSGKYLTTDGTTPSWGTISTGGLTLLSTTTLTGSSVTISSISGSYKNLQLIIKDAYATTNDDIAIRFNSDTSANYMYSRVRNIGTTLAGGNAVNQIYIPITAGLTTNNTAKEKAFATVFIPRYTDTDIQEITSTSYSYQGSLPTYFGLSGVYDKSAAITSITLFMLSGNYSGGTAYLYGES